MSKYQVVFVGLVGTYLFLFASESLCGELSVPLQPRPRAAKNVSDSVMVVRTDLIDGRYYTYLTGTIRNDSRAGIYGFGAVVVYRDSRGRAIKESGLRLTVIGHPAKVYGYGYRDADAFHLSFIPPLYEGYFRARVEVPDNADLGMSEIVLSWSWTLRASLLRASAINIKLPVQDDGSLYDHEATFDVLFSGEWGKDETVTDLTAYLIGIGKGGAVSTILSFDWDENYYPSDQTGSDKPLISKRVRFDDTSSEFPVERVELRIAYRILVGSYTDSDISFLSVRDTVFLPSDTIRVLSALDSTRLSAIKL